MQVVTISNLNNDTEINMQKIVFVLELVRKQNSKEVLNKRVAYLDSSNSLESFLALLRVEFSWGKYF